MTKAAAILLFAANVVYLFVTLDQLPEPLAVHFNAEGVPDGWMTHEHHVLFMLALLAVFAVLLLALPGLFDRLPRWMLSVPHRDQWLAPERRARFLELMARFGQDVAVVTAGFFLVMQYLIVQANLSDPVRLDNRALLVALAVFIVALLVPGISLMRRLRQP